MYRLKETVVNVIVYDFNDIVVLQVFFVCKNFSLMLLVLQIFVNMLNSEKQYEKLHI